MNKSLIFASLISILVATGCAPTPVKEVTRVPFPVELYASLPKEGKSTVEGNVYAFTPEGDKVTTVEFVRLMPVTPYQEQWYKEHYLSVSHMADPDPRVYDYFFEAKVGSDGTYKITNVPAGKYYIAALFKKERRIPLDGGGIMVGEDKLFLCEELVVSGEIVVKDVTNG